MLCRKVDGRLAGAAITINFRTSWKTIHHQIVLWWWIDGKHCREYEKQYYNSTMAGRKQPKYSKIFAGRNGKNHQFNTKWNRLLTYVNSKMKQFYQPQEGSSTDRTSFSCRILPKYNLVVNWAGAQKLPLDFYAENDEKNHVSGQKFPGVGGI